MAYRTQLFQQIPWQGGLNTSQDESMIPPNQLTNANNVVFDTRGSRKKRDGIKHNWDDVTSGSVSIIGLHDFWYGTSSKTQRLISVGNNRTVRSYNAGTATSLTVSGTAWSGTLTSCSMVTFNNLCIVAVSGSGNVVKKYSGSGDVEDLDGTPPEASILCSHLGRLWTNDKTNKDRIHCSPTHDHTKWNGSGDSWAFDIGVGDGDPDGVTAMVSFKGNLFIFKRNKLYRMTGYSPETFTFELVSSGVGCISHNSIALIDQDDVYFVSTRGVHSLNATQAYGDFQGAFLSYDIQRTFNDSISRSRLQFSWGAYLDNINSFALALSTSGSSTNDVIYLYHIPLKAWYVWPKKRFYLGSNVTRVSKTFNGTNYDISTSGTNTAIQFRVTTGLIFPDNNPYTAKAFKRFILYYKPSGTHSITATIRVDNKSLNSENAISFTNTSSSALLGSTFTLGVSLLGSSAVVGPYSMSIEGIGRGFKVDLTQTGTDEQIEIQGFAVEYEILGPIAEV
jgi:hypothetical protein